jgi:hypothetical protein
MLADSGEINSQTPELWSVSRDDTVFYVTRVLQYVVHRWSERQVSNRETSWLQSFSQSSLENVVTVTGSFAEFSWRSLTLLSLQKAACSPQSREFKANSRHTVNPRKIVMLAPTIPTMFLWWEHLKYISFAISTMQYILLNYSHHNGIDSNWKFITFDQYIFLIFFLYPPPILPSPSMGSCILHIFNWLSLSIWCSVTELFHLT